MPQGGRTVNPRRLCDPGCVPIFDVRADESAEAATSQGQALHLLQILPAGLPGVVEIGAAVCETNGDRTLANLKISYARLAGSIIIAAP